MTSREYVYLLSLHFRDHVPGAIVRRFKKRDGSASLVVRLCDCGGCEGSNMVAIRTITGHAAIHMKAPHKQAKQEAWEMVLDMVKPGRWPQ
jgi:hypothetical protein